MLGIDRDVPGRGDASGGITDVPACFDLGGRLAGQGGHPPVLGGVAEGFRRDRRSFLDRAFRDRKAKLRVAGKVCAGFLGVRARVTCHEDLLKLLLGQCQEDMPVPLLLFLIHAPT
ncbi:hypothetical protein MicloDRAFT_00058230 [Microvirga lotononidis]|uniref:Uncharacterized protein n=1 Tax=Microvirga lotononidis TaxID=864069 RepID=I4YMB1_9HYPH|nr:hypothetical protein MicloDRAFT_00058230 [Microvirga lotononidis]